MTSARIEITELGPRAVASAIDDPVWALTCDQALIAAIERERHYRAALPVGWALLCDVDPSELPDDLRDRPAGARERGVFQGGLPIDDGVWLLDHPPQLACDLPEPAPVAIGGTDRGYAEPGQPVDLAEIAHSRGVHTIFIADRAFTLELVEREPRSGMGTLSVDTDPRRVHHGARRDVAADAPTVTGARVRPAGEPWEPPLIVRYRAQVDVIDTDGTVRSLAPPAAAAPWLGHVGLTPGDAWEIPEPSEAVWICGLAADLLDVLLHGAPRLDRWATVRTSAVQKVCQDFAWIDLDTGADRPVLDANGTLICVVHPLDNIDVGIRSGIETPHGDALPFDCFNFDRRPGEIFGRL